ncbi:serine/threonine-protein kinase Sgk2-like [Panonychus citri]|uniref:serine/threonine-protein kinase Sgk2-like n=1 Tax=Panonychus citri TaxID=50023 RepID=UPI00230745C7|nr:serine/threonine-protein kinase Sgk2-like [Panonychus citri]XP_053211481.1 serine/threonine-protein kinase Sgk2-like [Panonychus citri]
MVDLSRWDRWKVKLKLGNSRRSNKSPGTNVKLNGNGSPSSIDLRSADQSSSSSSSDGDIESMSVDGCWPGPRQSEVILCSSPNGISTISSPNATPTDLNSSSGSDLIGTNAANKSLDLGPSEKKHAKPSDFEFLKVIGHGSFGKVLIARHKAEEQIYAVKVLQKKVILKKNERNNVMCERNVLLKNLHHPFLVGLHYSFQSRDKLYFVLDYVNGGELFFHLQRDKYFSENRARFYAAEITLALGYLHSQGIVYRDLKPENILLDCDGHVVLTDFGLCKDGLRDRDTTSTFCGTPEYLAPEVLRKEAYDRRVDWWCLGAVLYEMLYGLPPFYSRDTVEMYDNILNKPVRLRTNISLAARSILEGLLQKDKRKRLGAKNDSDEIKRHDFFKPISWTELEFKQVSPPFNPNVKGYMDLKNIDPDFTKEPVPQSVCKSVNIFGANSIPDNAFPGFSYAEAH